MEPISLDERLRRAGSGMPTEWMRPLAGDDIREVFAALARITGSEYPNWLAEQLKRNNYYGYVFDEEGLPDNTFDGPIHRLFDKTRLEPEENQAEWFSSAGLLRQLLIEPLSALSSGNAFYTAFQLWRRYHVLRHYAPLGET